MIIPRPANLRGHTKTSWLDSWHSFSFGDYYNPEEMNFGVLRVINEDFVAPGQGFATHGHRNMEIITYVLSGSVQHQDSLGTKTVIAANEIQCMSAGSGIRHSEFNPSHTDALHLLQIWIQPNQLGLPPQYQQQLWNKEKNKWVLLAAPKKDNAPLLIHQDTKLYCALIENNSLSFSLSTERMAYVHVAKGMVVINGSKFIAGDGAKITGENSLNFSGNGEFLLFDLPNI